MEGFLRYEFGGLIHGGAYFLNLRYASPLAIRFIELPLYRSRENCSSYKGPRCIEVCYVDVPICSMKCKMMHPPP